MALFYIVIIENTNQIKIYRKEMKSVMNMRFKMRYLGVITLDMVASSLIFNITSKMLVSTEIKALCMD